MYDSAALRGTYLKLDRAREHATSLSASMTRATESAKHSIVISHQLSTRSKSVYTVVDPPRVDPMWPLIIGDFLTNVRAALDHLAWQLARFGGGTQDRSTQFPILAKDKPLTSFSGVTDATILEALNEVQPAYSAATRNGGLENHGLFLLNKLVNIDKHETLHVVAYVVDTERIFWLADEDAPSPTLSLTESTLSNGDVAATFDFNGATPPAGFEPHLALRFRLDSGPDVPALRRPEVLGVMQRIYWTVEQDVVGRRFAPLFGLPPRHDVRLH